MQFLQNCKSLKILLLTFKLKYVSYFERAKDIFDISTSKIKCTSSEKKSFISCFSKKISSAAFPISEISKRKCYQNPFHNIVDFNAYRNKCFRRDGKNGVKILIIWNNNFFAHMMLLPFCCMPWRCLNSCFEIS